MNRIRELRKEYKMTQTELAHHVRTTTSNVSGWECGKWQPDNDMLVKLAELFDVSVDYLLGRPSTEQPTITPEERAVGAAETKAVRVTPAEDELLYLYREAGKKHGEKAQQAVLDIMRNFLTDDKN